MFFRRTKNPFTNKSNLIEVKSPVDTALIIICEKCGKKMNPEAGQNPSIQFQQSLKAEIKERNLKGKIRAITSSCLDICPENRIAIGLSFAKPTDQADRFFTITPESFTALKNELIELK